MARNKMQNDSLPGYWVVGMAASLIISRDDYDLTANWRDLTNVGKFTDHNPSKGRS
jgi:hypothetical protein